MFAFYRDFLRIIVVIRMFEVEITLVQFQYANVLNLRVATEIVFLYAGLHTIAVALAARDIDGVTEHDAFLWWRVFASYVDAISTLGPAFYPIQSCLDLLGRHSAIVFLEEIGESILERLASPGGLCDSSGCTQANASQKISARFVEVVTCSFTAAVITHCFHAPLEIPRWSASHARRDVRVRGQHERVAPALAREP